MISINTSSKYLVVVSHASCVFSIIFYTHGFSSVHNNKHKTFLFFLSNILNPTIRATSNSILVTDFFNCHQNKRVSFLQLQQFYSIISRHFISYILSFFFLQQTCKYTIKSNHYYRGERERKLTPSLFLLSQRLVYKLLYSSIQNNLTVFSQQNSC